MTLAFLFILTDFFQFYRTKCDTTEEEQLEEEFKNLFPNFHDQDFADFQQANLSDDTIVKSEMVDAPVILPEDIEYIANVHSKFVFNCTKTEWLNPKRDKNLCVDFITPLIEKFKIFKLLVDKASDSLHYTMDSQIVGSLSVLVAVAQNYGEVDIEGMIIAIKY